MNRKLLFIVSLAAVLALAATGCQKLRAWDQLNRGVQAYRGAQYPVAVEHFKQALQLKPDDISACKNLALAYANMRQSSDAVAAAEKALALAKSQGQAAQAEQIEDWLKSYRTKLSNPTNASLPLQSAPMP